MLHDMLGTPRITRLIAGGTLSLVLVAGSSITWGQTQPVRVVRVTVTDPSNRFVTGIDRDNFQIVENGVARPITGFWDVDSPVTIAIVGETALPVRNSDRAGDELIQAKSVAEAVERLMLSRNPRKALVVTTGADTRGVSGDIQVVQASSENLAKWMIELRNQYVVQFASSAANARVEVVLQQPQGLPLLRMHLE
jgi:hypothetical protein